MELQSAKYYQEPEPAKQAELATFSKPGDDKPAPPPTHAEELSIMVVSGSLAVIVLGFYGSMYAVCKVFRIAVSHRRRMGAWFELMERILGDYCKTPEDSWITYGVFSAMVVLGLIVIGCVRRNAKSKKACRGSAVAELALEAGEHLRAGGRHAFSIATAYLVGGTVVSMAGITWMTTLYQEHEPAGVSVIFMTLLTQLGIAACLGGGFCLLREPANASQTQEELSADDTMPTRA